jgi:23S rRNA (guanosine2251-2'-O)-methyltransferase
MNNPHRLPNRLEQDQLVMGAHAIDELLRHAPEKILHIYAAKKGDYQKVPVTILSFDQLTKMVGSDSHQGVIAHIRPRKYFDVKEFLEGIGEECFILMLDQIFDPQNLGALIRVAECFGASAVLFSKNRGANLTAVAAKTSCGASELLPLIRVSNLATAAEQFQEAGFEVVVSVLNEKAESAFSFRFAPKTVLIMGSEGEGIQPLLQKKADRAIYLPMKGKIQSLNVAQAASALLAIRAMSIK